jgi:hypothetical protein
MRQTFASKQLAQDLEDDEAVRVAPGKSLNTDARKQILQNLQEDPMLYDYDSYLEVKEKKVHERLRPNFRAEPKNSKYQDKLIQQAELRKVEREIYQDQLRDKQIKRESKTDADPVAYVTDAYKQFVKEKRRHALKAEHDSMRDIGKGLAEFQKAQLGLQSQKTHETKYEIDGDPNRTPSPEKGNHGERETSQKQAKVSEHHSTQNMTKLPVNDTKAISSLIESEEIIALNKRNTDRFESLQSANQQMADHNFHQQKSKGDFEYHREQLTTELTKEQKLEAARRKFEERKKLKSS